MKDSGSLLPRGCCKDCPCHFPANDSQHLESLGSHSKQLNSNALKQPYILVVDLADKSAVSRCSRNVLKLEIMHCPKSASQTKEKVHSVQNPIAKCSIPRPCRGLSHPSGYAIDMGQHTFVAA